MFGQMSILDMSLADFRLLCFVSIPQETAWNNRIFMHARDSVQCRSKLPDIEAMLQISRIHPLSETMYMYQTGAYTYEIRIEISQEYPDYRREMAQTS